MKSALSLFCLCCCLAACDQIAELDGSKVAESDGRAVGGACRHAGRALEDCYLLNERAPRAAVFAGWREMNDYMTQNKMETIAPQLQKKMASAKPDDAAAKLERRDHALAPTPAAGFKAAAAVNETGAPAAGVSSSAATGAREPKLTHEGLPQHLLPAGATGRELDKLAQ